MKNPRATTMETRGLERTDDVINTNLPKGLSLVGFI